MVTDQLLTYIRQNLANGLARPDIEKALRAAGWQPDDITGGFNTIEHPVVPPPAPSSSVASPAESNAAEVARIQRELEAQAKRRGLSNAPTVGTPTTGGITGWLIRKKVVEEESQANVALLGVAVIAIVLTVAVFIWGNSSTPTPGPTQQEINAMHQPLAAPAHPAQ